MSVSEFSLIERYFAAHRFQRSDVALGIGDDCALLLPPTGQQLATTVDTLVSIWRRWAQPRLGPRWR
jgi:thiamine-monophosphate kinase